MTEQTHYEIRIAIGSPNDTHKIDIEYLDKIVKWANKNFVGYTLYHTKGYWKGTVEDSVIISTLSREPPSKILKRHISVLNVELKQDSILLTYAPLDFGFIGSINAKGV